ncbi:MAG TPA: BamA/TamA family outer membrane protein [Gemmatimonadales bacterium]|nr:BamA/TamA family outer membrane protein [Gemmatimonadales bacterium]
MPRSLLLGALLASALLVPATLSAQDSVIVIDPSAPFADSALTGGPPIEVVRRAVAAYNDSATTRIAGDLAVPTGAAMPGPLAVYGGTLRVSGAVDGAVVVINGTLALDSNATVGGDVLVVGGRLHRSAGAVINGEIQVYWDAAPVERQPDGQLTLRPRTRLLSQLGGARARFGVGPLQATLMASTGGTYNRIEGLPIVLGPSLTWRPDSTQALRLDLRGIVRTVGTGSQLRSDVGYSARLEWRRRNPRVGLVVGVHSRIVPMRSRTLSAMESGWSAFLLQRDYHDYFESRGISGEVFGYPIRQLRLGIVVGRDQESTVLASDPWSLFRNRDRWRPNPPIDDGHYVHLAARLRYDTRNSNDNPSSGWFGDITVEHSNSDDVSPLQLPSGVRGSIPPGNGYAFNRLSFDLRRYTRVGPSLRVAARVTGGGWLGGDPLPVQERLALGGPDLLPGYGFRAVNCAPNGVVDPAQTALCDRMLAAQLELRTRVGIDPGRILPKPVSDAIERVVGLREADLVFLGDAGMGWLSGDGPGRVPNNRIPVLNEWRYDVGGGLDTGTLGIYLAKALTGREPLRLFVRLQHRF